MASNKLIKCKTCGAEVAKSAKVCPSCGAKIKRNNLILIVIIAVVVLIAIIASSGGNDEPKKVGDNSQSAIVNGVEEKEEKTSFSVGEIVELKDITVSMVNVTESTGSSFNKPTDGNVYVLCEFDISNNSDREISVSSIMSFEAYCDDYTCNFSLGALMEKGNKNQLDGTVASGKKFNGVVGYEVPVDWKELEIRFTPDFWSGKDIVFVANK